MASKTTLIGIGVWSYKHLCALYLTLIVFSNVTMLLDYKYSTSNAPILDAIILLLVIPLALGHVNKWKPFLKTGFFKWCCLLAIVYIINWLRLTYGDYLYTEVEMIDEVNRMQRVILWPVIGFMIYVIDTRYFKTGFLILLVVMPLITFMDFLAPQILEAPTEVLSARAQGAYLNANVAAEAAIILGIINFHRFKGFLAVAFFLIVGLGVLVTFSRSGIVALILFYGFLFARNRMPKLTIIAPVLLVLSFSTLLIYAEDVLLTLGYDSSVTNALARLSFFESINTETITADDSGATRTEVAGAVFADSLSKPIVGHVLDAHSVYETNPHNTALFFWYKYGILGLLVWILMLVMLWRAGIRGGTGLLNPAFFIFLWFSFFSHNLFGFRFWIIAWSFFLLKPTVDWHGSLQLLPGLRVLNGIRFGKIAPSKNAGRSPHHASSRRKRRKKALRF